MKKTIIYLVSAALAIAACSKDNSINSVTGLKGNWYEIGNTSLIDHFISFDGGSFAIYGHNDKHYTCRDTVYTCADSADTFKPAYSEEYHIIEGRLICSNHNYGPISVQNDTLNLNGRKYVRLNVFRKAGYSRIDVERGTIPDLGPELDANTTRFCIIRPDQKEFKGYAYASSEQSWLYGIHTEGLGVDENGDENYQLTFHIMANPDKKSRIGKITIFYPPALPQEINVIQSGAEI